MFINRDSELTALQSRFGSQTPQLLIVYGRRRVGKTELLRAFMQEKPHIYYMADRRTEREQLELFSARMAEFFNDPVVKEQPIQSWDLVFTYISKNLNRREKLVIVLDEFPYLAEVNPALPSIIQRHWDERLKKSGIYLILCGSSMSFMEKELLSHKSPLYGRRTGQMEITPFGIPEIREMFPAVPPQRLVELYSVFGGIPAYLGFYNARENLWTNIAEQIFPADTFLYNEVHFLLMEEMRTPHNYFAILKAIAYGDTKVNEIVQRTGLERGVVGKYLDHLIDLRIIERMIPVTDNPVKSRRGLYRFRDNYFRFWFKYIYPNKSYLEEGRTSLVMSAIKKDFPAFVGPVFEDIARAYIRRHEVMGSAVKKAGSWWEKNIEIDIAAFDEKDRMIIGECKWSNKKVGVDIYRNLRLKQKHLTDYAREFRYVLFSKSGFTDDMKKLARDDGVVLYSLDDILSEGN